MFSISAIEVGVIEFDQFFKFGFDLVLAGIGVEAQSFARAGLPFKDARGGSAAAHTLLLLLALFAEGIEIIAHFLGMETARPSRTETPCGSMADHRRFLKIENLGFAHLGEEIKGFIVIADMFAAHISRFIRRIMFWRTMRSAARAAGHLTARLLGVGRALRLAIARAHHVEIC